MFQSMAVICAAAGVIYLFVPHDDTADPLKPVDYRVELVTAQRAAPYPVAAPRDLGAGWRPTSVSYDREGADAWHLGFLTPEREYVAVEQSTDSPVEHAVRVTHDARDTGRVQRVGGRTWERWEGPKYDALVLRGEGVTTVVTGTASFERLGQMAAALRTGTDAAGETAPGQTAAPGKPAPGESAAEEKPAAGKG
ncbi:DUF4245 domain-containing protein [Streptomyces somaliensis DSM 40738]|nr:DUF4245 domain-containing protein [Streptomyces somaliensis DSM 40738]